MWGTHSDEETRASLQSRLAALCKAMFWAFLALIVFLFAMYAKYKSIEPEYQQYIWGVAIVALTMLAFIWRVILLRRKDLSIDTLYFIDLVVMIGAGTSFGLVAVLAYELRASHYTCLIYASYAVFTRALLVPSSGSRTLVVSSACFAPVTIAAAVLALHVKLELPGPAFFVGDLLFSGAAISLAAVGSRIIYSLRREVSEAMQLGMYKLDRMIGEGGIGRVYRAHHTLLRRPTAIKLLQPDKVGAENIERFEREVRTMSQLTHPNTVAVFDYGHSPDGLFYYAMEYLGGGMNLEQLVKKHGPQPSGRVIKILAQVAGALQEAHGKKLIHRDIKPANILLCERGGIPDFAKVVDYGLVKEITADTGASTQVVLGTPAYIAPEALNDPANVGPGADLYALGCTGFYLLTGRPVFQGKTVVDICVQHITSPPKRPSELTTKPVDPALEAVLMKCLAKTPSERYASAGELVDALLAIPPQADWSDAQARTFWNEHRTGEESATIATTTPTLTVTVDLGHREA